MGDFNAELPGNDGASAPRSIGQRAIRGAGCLGVIVAATLVARSAYISLLEGNNQRTYNAIAREMEQRYGLVAVTLTGQNVLERVSSGDGEEASLIIRYDGKNYLANLVQSGGFEEAPVYKVDMMNTVPDGFSVKK